ncbi:MAG: hypothetical protein GTN62_03030, partial [Gemmatimonadales bacterium]|nr:hypothetical protein [Gemmatimonadales bacterium]NIN49073.1 hypothetical protein [Gemmatimonadales bacterium]NIP06537.1 hypothetical protein [Gemmatimonadales bacterium]NIR00234.1 hypothetical protein [Gemmatimonadales bacterium]NIS64567.1 hypothetical protein [Gemmatimonadales bacterium]
MNAIAEHRESVLRWWRGLSGGEAGKLAAGVSRSRYVRVSGDTSQAALNRKIADEELFAYFVIGPDPVSGSE